MNIYIDIETLRAPEETRIEILEGVKANFKAPATLSKTQAAIDLGLTDKSEIKFTSKDDMITRWEKELAEEKSGGVADEIWKKTSFNPDVAPIACICVSYNHNGLNCQQYFDLMNFKSEHNLLSEFHEFITVICSKNGSVIHKPNFIGHNLGKFDLPFIWKRSVINNVKCCAGVKWQDGRHGQHFYDTMIAWSGFGNRISMDNLAKLLKLGGKGDVDGSMVYDLWQKDPVKVIEYCHADVSVVKSIHERLEGLNHD